MPRIKSVSLSDKCLVVIVKNVDKFCIKSAKKQLGEVDANVAGLSDSPCNRLPSLLLDKLVMMLLETCRIDKIGVEFLISINHCTLDLSQCQQEEKAGLLLAGSIRSQNLKTLKLGCINVEPEYLNCISKFIHLQILEFSQCSNGDKLLRIVGAHCPDLRELHVRGEVSDTGIHDLCVIGKCKSINTLILKETNVTIFGIKMVFANLPALRTIYHPSTVEVLANMDDQKPLLTEFFFLPDSSYRYDILRRAVVRCPFITKIHIVKSKEFSTFELLDLRLLKKLDCFDISITGFSHDDMHFGFGIAPLLQSIGSPLKTLSISTHFGVNIMFLITYCPNLLSLTLKRNAIPSGTVPTVEEQQLPLGRGKMQRPMFRKLKRLQLCGPIPVAELITLLSSVSLSYISIEHCNNLTDEVLNITANRRFFQNLEHFEISFCINITSIGIDYLMNEGNPIKVIKFCNCPNLSIVDIENWKRKSSEKNWQLSVSESVNDGIN